MLKHRFVALAITFALCSMPTLAQTPMTDATAAALGRRDARVITSFREPVICAPTVLVLQCERDLDAFAGVSMDQDLKIPNAGPAPLRALRTAIAEGDLVHASRALGYINAQAYPALLPRQQAIAAAAQAAGLIRSAGANRLLQTLSAGPLISPALAPQLAQLGLTPPNAAAMLSPSGDAATSAFLHAVDVAFPPGALLALPPLDGRHDELVLGIAMSTLGEFIELPDLVVLPELQPFVTEAFARFHAVAPSTDADANVVRSAFGSADAGRRQAAFVAINRIDTALVAALGETSPAARRFLIGSTITQIGYNAATFRELKMGAFAHVIATYLDALPAGDSLRQPVGSLYGLLPDDFANQRKLATAFVITALHLAQP